MRIFGFLVAILAVAATPAHAAAAQASDAQIAAFFDAYVRKAVAEAEVPGAALVVVRDGRVIHSKGYGVADLVSRRPLSPSAHLLRQGSISKVATWIMAMQLAETGNLDLDRDVNAYLTFRVVGQSGRPITMRHLMTHSSGFTERFMGVFGRPQGALCAALRDNLPARTAAPGERISYSNSGAGLAACVIEGVTKQPFEQAAQQMVFRPLGMDSATFAQPPSGRLARRLASHYPASRQDPQAFEYIGIAPAGSLSAPAADMGRLLSALMSGGRGQAGQILSPKATADMLRLHKPLAPGLRSGFGLGFIVREHGGMQIVGHGGTMMAAITDMEIIPELGLGWYIGMTGLGYGGRATDIRAAMPGAVIDRFGPGLSAVGSHGPSSAAELAGTWLPARRYRSGPLKMSDLNLIRVSAAPDGSIRIDSVTDAEGIPRRWLPQGRDRFVEESTGTELVAIRDAAGKVVRFASTLVNPVSDLERAAPWLSLAVPMFGGSAAILLLGGVIVAVAAIVRRIRRKGPPNAVESQRWSGASKLCLAGLVATLIGWTALMAVVSDNPYRMTGVQAPLFALGLMAMIAPALALPILARGSVLLRNRQWFCGAGVSLIGLSGLVCGLMYYALGLATISTDF